MQCKKDKLKNQKLRLHSSVTSSLAINQTIRMAYRQEQGQQQQQQQQQFVGPTLYISRTHKNIRQERVFAVLRQLKLGWIGKIDMVPKKSIQKMPNGTETTKEYVSVYIHFTKWFTDNRQTQQFLERLDSTGFVHIVYDEPWFWKVTKYVPKEHKPQPQSRYPRPRIDFGAAAVTIPVAVPAQDVQSIGARSVSRCDDASSASTDSRKKRYWATQAETATAAVMAKRHSHSVSSPTPRSHGSDSESSPSPIIHRNVTVRLFD